MAGLKKSRANVNRLRKTRKVYDKIFMANSLKMCVFGECRHTTQYTELRRGNEPCWSL